MLDTFAFLLLIAALVGIGSYHATKVRHNEGYLFASRKASLAALTATLVMTEFNSGTLIAFSSLGYLVGYWALTLPFIFLLGLLFYALVAAKKWKEFDGDSVAGFFTQKYGTRIGRTASGFLLVAQLGFSAAYIKSLTLLFQPIVPQWSPWALSFAFLLMISIMTLRGGLMAIIRTDVFTFLLVLVFFPLLAWRVWTPGLQPVPLEGPVNLPPSFILSLIMLTLFTYILAPWYGQKIFAARDKRTAFWSVFIASILVFFLYGCAILATAFFRYRGFEVSSCQEALPMVLKTMLPHGVQGVAYGLLFATSATTLTGLWSSMAAMWINDFGKKTIDYRTGVLVTLLFACASYVLANTLVDQVFDKMILANIPVAALAFGLLAGFYWKRVTSLGVALSIVIGIAFAVGAFLTCGESYTWYWAFCGIPLSFVGGIIGSLLTPKRAFA